jgi:hypothetical protein
VTVRLESMTDMPPNNPDATNRGTTQTFFMGNMRAFQDEFLPDVVEPNNRAPVQPVKCGPISRFQKFAELKEVKVRWPPWRV